MALGVILKGATQLAKGLAKMASKKPKTKPRANVGKKQTDSVPAGVSKKTKAVKKEERHSKSATGGQRMKNQGSTRREGTKALEAKAARTKRQLSAEQSARRKSTTTNSAARTKAQQKKDKK